MFGTLQVVPSWLRQFGELKNGKWVLTSERKAIMSSGTSTEQLPGLTFLTNQLPRLFPVQWIGKILGTMIVEPLIDRVGFKRSMMVVVLLQIIGCLSEYI
jgi:SP family sugar:H+ symporter-like MFS transporter